ncbi:hypothetical protein [Archangium violaceum]|nr:hypothetical protein [Archangium violaceum]
MLLAIVSVQGGATFAKELFPALGLAGTAGMRIALVKDMEALGLRH